MNKKIPLGGAIAFMVIVAGITFCITMMVSLNHFNTLVLNVKNREEMYKKIADLDREVRQNFDGEYDEDILLDSISDGYVKGLGDRYSKYLTKDEYEQRLVDLSGTAVGIGATIEKDDSGYLKVKKLINKAPADLAGIKENDLIISIDGTDLKTVSYDNAIRLIKGNVGTKINLVYRRDGVDTPIEIIRKDIIVPYVELTMMGKNAYIKITEFNESTPKQFKEAVDKANKDGATGLIFDLRDNGGGTVRACTDMLDLLLPSGKLGTTIDKDGKTKTLATSDRFEIDLPMVTIINEKSASASELFVATLRDFGKANSVGTTSYGKGVMQTLIKLTDGSAISITTAHFFPPSGNAINGVGIKPDYEVKFPAELENNMDSLTKDNDPQISKAIEVINSKKSE